MEENKDVPCVLPEEVSDKDGSLHRGAPYSIDERGLYLFKISPVILIHRERFLSLLPPSHFGYRGENR